MQILKKYHITTVVYIGMGAFENCSNMRVVILNDGLQKIGDWAFLKCTSLESVTLPSTLTEFGSDAFKSCSNLREVTLNNGLQQIGGRVFRDCTSLKSIKLPPTVTEIGAGAFNNSKI